jgi:hypothetical protein
MSASILAEIFGIKEGYEVVRTEYGGHFLRLQLDVESAQFVCPKCGSREVSRKGRRHRELQTVPMGLTPVYLLGPRGLLGRSGAWVRGSLLYGFIGCVLRFQSLQRRKAKKVALIST